MHAILLFPILEAGQDKHKELDASYSSFYFVGAIAIASLERLRLFKWIPHFKCTKGLKRIETFRLGDTVL